jgi:hypothetical protein
MSNMNKEEGSIEIGRATFLARFKAEQKVKEEEFEEKMKRKGEDKITPSDSQRQWRAFDRMENLK